MTLPAPREQTPAAAALRDAPQILAAMRAQLDLAASLDEVKSLVDRAEVIRVAARKAGAMRDIQNDAAEYKLDAERKAGQMLAQLERNPGIRTDLEPRGSLTRGSEYRETLRAADIDESAAKRWQRIAAIPEDEYEAYKADARSKGEVTESGAVKLARQRAKAEKVATIAAQPVADLPQDVTFPVLLADPPWRYDYAEDTTRQIENHYPTMPLDDIAALKVPAADDAVLFMWTTSPKLREAFTVLDGWGFTYRTCMVWVKDKIGMGYYARQQHELLFIASRGKLPVPEPSDRPPSVFHGARTAHSAKPPIVHELIERMYPHYRRCELFARSPRPGWDVWGNQAAEGAA